MRYAGVDWEVGGRPGRREAVRRPAQRAAAHRNDVAVAQALQHLGGEHRAPAALADQHQLGVVVVEVEGRDFLEFRPRDAARALGPAPLALVVLAHVDPHRTLGLPQLCFVWLDPGTPDTAIIAEKTVGE